MPVDDLFDSTLTVEEDYIREGFEEGVKDGRAAGHTEGRALGLQKGFEVGHELGYYRGCLGLWRQLLARTESSGSDGAGTASSAAAAPLASERAQRGMAALQAQLDAFPLDNPQDERLQELMDGIRGRFKALVAALGLPQEALGPAAGAPQGGQAF